MSVLVDRKPERAAQAKIRGIQKIHSRWIENPKGQFRQKLGISKERIHAKESNDYLRGECEKYLSSVRKWQLLLKFRPIGTYPGNVLVVRLHPDNVWMFSSDIIPVQGYQVLVLWCRAAFWPVCVCLNKLTVIRSHKSRTYSFMHTKHAYRYHPRMFTLSCCFNYTDSVIRNVIQNVTNRVYLKWHAPKAAFYQYILVSPVFSPV